MGRSERTEKENKMTIYFDKRADEERTAEEEEQKKKRTHTKQQDVLLSLPNLYSLCYYGTG